MKFNLKKILAAAASAVMAVTVVSSAEISAYAAQTSSKLDVGKATTEEILQDMGIGWNLGNTLDATGSYGLNTETSWGNPKATQALIDEVKNEGFNTVRVPVSWNKHVSGDDYKIDTAWLKRVKEVVDYCYSNDMYVILNVHHDNGTGENLYYPDNAHLEESEKYITSVWTQIADYFKDYDNHLIFETLNEPRLVGTDYEWWWQTGDSTVSSSIKCINTLNQDAVDAIRKSGSNNKNRLIMCPSYSASLSGATEKAFKLPTDITGNSKRIILSVHAYSPYDFAMGIGTYSATSKYTDSIKSQLEDMFKTIKTNFTDKGIPVVIGEFGATNKNNTSARCQWARDFTSLAKSQNIVCCIWDNNYYESYSGSNFKYDSEYHGIINRSSLKPYNSEYVKALTEIYNYTNINECSISLSQTSYVYNGKYRSPSVTVKHNGKTLKKGTDYGVSYVSNLNAGTAFVVVSGKGAYCGSKTLKFTIKAKNASNLTFSSISSKVYTGKAITPAVTVKDGSVTLKKGKDYTVKYSSNKNIGTAKAVITFKGNYSGSKTLTFKILPKTESIKSISAVSKGFKVTYAKQSNVTGYQVQYSTNSKFTNAKHVNVKSYKTTSKTIKGLTGKKTYYVRVRSYKTVGGKTYKGAWSKVVKVKTKK